jgi:protein TonB
MQHEKSMDVDSKPKRTHFVELGFMFSLVILLLLLELMSYCSVHNIFNATYVVMNVPVEMSKAEDLMQMSLPQQQSSQPKDISPPSSSLPVIVADQAMVSDDIAIKSSTILKTETPEGPKSGNSSGSNANGDVEDPTPFSIVEDQPTYPQGTDALLKFLRDNIKYPYAAKQAGISGTVIISFIVEKDGSISTVKVVHGIGGECNKEAIRVVSMMPKWTPGKQRGIPVRVQFQIPLIFSLHAN